MPGENIEHIKIIADLVDRTASKNADKISDSMERMGDETHKTSDEIKVLTGEEAKEAKAQAKRYEQIQKYNKAQEEARKATADYVKVLDAQRRAKAEETRAVDAATRAKYQETHATEGNIRADEAKAKMVTANSKLKAAEVKVVEASIKAIEAETKALDAETRSLHEQNFTRREAISKRQDQLKATALSLRALEAEQRADTNVTTAQNALTKARMVDLKYVQEQRYEANRLRREQEKAEKQMRALNNQMTRTQRIAIGFDKIIRKLFTLRSLFSLFKIGSIFALVGQLIAGLTALGAAAYAAVAGLTPLLGNLVALPGFLFAGIQGMAVFAMGVRGIGEAIQLMGDPLADPEQMAAAMAKLAPAAREFVFAFREIMPAYKDLQKMVQQTLFGGMAENLKDLNAAYLPRFQNYLIATAAALKQVLNYWTDIFLRPDVMQTVSDIMYTNSILIKDIGEGLAEWTVNLLKLVNLAAPALKEMAADFKEAGINFGTWIDAHPETITDFFSQAYDLMQKTWRVLKDLSVGFYNVGVASGVMSRHLGGGMERIAKNFKDWTGSKEGQDRMRDFFEKMIPIVSAIGGLFRKIGEAFITIAETPGVAETWTKLGELVDPLTRLVTQTMTAGFVDSLIKIIEALANFGASGWADIVAQAFTIIAGAIELMAKALSTLSPETKEIIGTLFGAAMAYGVVSRISRKFPGVGVGKGGRGGGMPPVIIPGGGGGKPPVGGKPPMGTKGGRFGGPMAGIMAFLGMTYLNDLTTGGGKYRNPGMDALGDPTKLFDIDGQQKALWENYKTGMDDPSFRGKAFRAGFKVSTDMVEVVQHTVGALTGAFGQGIGDNLREKFLREHPELRDRFEAENGTEPYRPPYKLNDPLRPRAFNRFGTPSRPGMEGTGLSVMGSGPTPNRHGAWNRSFLDPKASQNRHEIEYKRTQAAAVGITRHVADKLIALDMDIRDKVTRDTAGLDAWINSHDNLFISPEQIEAKVAAIGAIMPNKLAQIEAETRAAVDDPSWGELVIQARRIFQMMLTRMGSLADQVRRRAILGISFGGALEGTGLFTGGEVSKGGIALVGEKGPEAFINNIGKVSMVGMNGPEILRFPQGGAVVNNPATVNPWTSNSGDTPKWALKALQSTYTGLAARFDGADPFAVESRYTASTDTTSTAYSAAQNPIQTLELLSTSVANLATEVANAKRRGISKQVSDSRGGPVPNVVLNAAGAGGITKGTVRAWIASATDEQRRRSERR